MSSFLGKGWKFPIEIDETTGRIKMSDEDAGIKESIRVIIGTFKGERVMRPDFGSEVNNYLYNMTDGATLTLLEQSVEDAIEEWEPRVEQVEAKAHFDNSTPEKVLIHISYVVRTTNNLYNEVFPFYLYEGAN